MKTNKVTETINKYLDVEMYEMYEENGALCVILRDIFEKGRNFDNDCLAIFNELFMEYDKSNYIKLDDNKVLLEFQ